MNKLQIDSKSPASKKLNDMNKLVKMIFLNSSKYELVCKIVLELLKENCEKVDKLILGYYFFFSYNKKKQNFFFMHKKINLNNN